MDFMQQARSKVPLQFHIVAVLALGAFCRLCLPLSHRYWAGLFFGEKQETIKETSTDTIAGMTIKSPLRYPGGKSRAIVQIEKYLPSSFTEFREPFVGGGSVFLFIRQKYPQARIWINDLNYDLYCFWKAAQQETENLARAVTKIKDEATNGPRLFDEMRNNLHADISEFERAVRFFVMNRISFSGTVDSGGYSELAFHSRFTDSSIKRLLRLGPLLQNVRITNLDFKQVIHKPGESVFIFLDPPYLAATKSRLYGKNGSLHTGFNHAEFAEEMQKCPHQWLITYDDTPEIHSNFASSNRYEWVLQYGMNNYKQDKAEKGRELFITNYVPQSVESNSAPR